MNMKELVERLNKAAKSYYSEGYSIMSDKESAARYFRALLLYNRAAFTLFRMLIREKRKKCDFSFFRNLISRVPQSSVRRGTRALYLLLKFSLSIASCALRRSRSFSSSAKAAYSASEIFPSRSR
mgnify:CR=1 FL=1